MYTQGLKQRSRRLAHLAVAVALSMALFGIANAHQEQGAVHTNGASAGQGRRNLLWDQPKEEPKEEEPVKIEPSPVYADSHKFVGPETPKVLYTTAPTPASYETATKVRSDKPYVDIYHRERDWVNAKGATKVDTWEGATYNYRAHSGKGSELRFNSGQRAFEVNHKEKYDVNFPETAVKVDGGMPIAVDHKVAVFGAGANETVLVASGNGPVYANAWAVNVGPTNTIGHGAGRRLLGKAARALLWDQPKEEPKEEEPVKIEPSPVYADSHKFVGPETPKVLYTTAPTPASYETATKVRSDKPYVDIYHRERDWVNAKGATKVDTWEGATYNYRAHSGKGSELRFNSGQRAFEVNHKEKYDVNFPETAVKVDGGMPIAVDHKVAVFGAGANETVLVASGNGPVYANAWAVNVGPTNTIGHGAGRRLLGKAARALLWDQPKEEPKEEEPVKIEPSPVYADSHKFVGPETPKVLYTTAPTPASYETATKVRSDKPYVDIYHRERDWVNAKGATKVDTWEGATYNYRAHSGKGSELRFNSGQRAFEVNHKEKYDVNFPETAVKVDGGMPIAVDHKVAVFGAGANETVLVASGNGPVYANAWAVNVGPTNTIGHGAGRRLLGKAARALLWDQPKEEPKEEEPVKIEPSPVYADSHKFVGPETPKVLYTTAPTPASYETATKVRSDKPYVDIYHRERDWVNAKGATKVDTWEGATYNYRAHSGKGSELRFNSGQRAFEVNHKEKYDVNFPETAVKVDGGMPIAVDHKVAVFGAGANETVLVASGNGPVYANAWAVNVGPTNTIGHGAGRRRAQ